jgi:hypothetical protein
MRVAPWLGGVLTAAVVYAGLAQAFILQSATGAGDCDLPADASQGETDALPTECETLNMKIFDVVDQLMGPALWIVVALAPLTIAWGGGMMLFGGKHGPQLMGGAVVAVVLVASAQGIAA